ncbi:MAG TPA: gliding motility-associated C-terminal domain-containing protein [Chitinophaga sp.]|uniref:T9SS type B sorting domain-containing protein n=1 Tax=Chitinophaga sp. TaxID=1869181 RepID=UPI002BE7A3A0|nr:gliding motility-associated C-terminal domain-containing protein [Chitinophaga sp.]HVI47018.1 gliding motility-associated C-terminal domain-containing protein [Chitinophaga sp.]
MLKRIFIFMICLCLRKAVVVAQVRYIMQGQQVKLVASPANAPRYQWYRDGQPLPGAAVYEYLTGVPGIYKVEVYNQEGCVSELSDPVTLALIAGDAEADMQIRKTADNKPMLVNNTLNYYLTVTNNGPSIATGVTITDKLPSKMKMEQLGIPSSGNTYYNVNDHTILWKIDELQARMTATLTISVKASETGPVINTAQVSANEKDNNLQNNQRSHRLEVLSLHIPNAFTPNGDGTNDVFVITGLERYGQNELTILNRWGNHVFEQKSYSQNWDGKGLNDGTYFYLLRVMDRNGQWLEFKGYITLLRP